MMLIIWPVYKSKVTEYFLEHLDIIGSLGFSAILVSGMLLNKIRDDKRKGH